jgi:C1A family cysteine protease
MKRSYGWRKQKPDHRDWHHHVSPRVTLHLAPTIDLSDNMGPLLNQGNLGSCGPNTADEVVTFDQRVESLPLVYASRLFIYWHTRFLMGTVDEDSGVDNRTMLKAMATYGFCSEDLWPYADDDKTFKTKPDAAAISAAALNKITNYAAVRQALSQMQGCLASGFPFIFGFQVFDQIESDTAAANGILTMPKGSPSGGHDVSIVGYSTVNAPGVSGGNVWPAGTFKFRNHWVNEDGSPWGDGGYGYIPFAYATGKHASDFWVINAINANQ